MKPNSTLPDRCHIMTTRGFTLVELLITIVIASFIVAGVYSAYRVQQSQYTIQNQVIEMQQNIRTVVGFIMDELRMAGYDPENAGATFLQADQHRIHFTKDTTDTAGTADDGDGALDGPLENVMFGFEVADDGNSDGIADSGSASMGLSLDNGVNFASIAEDIQAIEFNYIMDDGTSTTSTTDFDNIYSVTISILARSSRIDQSFTNTRAYTTGSGAVWGPFNDNYRRRLLVTNVRCRNMGL